MLILGTKKVQQVLAQEGVLERFVANEEDAQLIRSFFAGLYSLDEGDAEKANLRVSDVVWAVCE